MVACAVVHLVGLKLHLWRQLEAAQRTGELEGIDALFLVGDQPDSVGRRVPEPVARGGHLAAVHLADLGHELLDMRNAGLVPVPLEHPVPEPSLERLPLHILELGIAPGNRNLLVDAELDDLLHAIDHVLALDQHEDNVGLGGARLDQIRGEVGGPKRGKFVPGGGAAEILEVDRKALLQRVAEGVVRCDEVPPLAVFLVHSVGHRVGHRPRGVAHAIDVPVAVRPGDRVGMAARNDVQHLILTCDLGERQSDRRVHIPDEERHLVAVDQLVRLLHAGAGVVRRILDEQFDGAAENAALRVDLPDGELGTGHFVLGGRRIGSGERIDHADAKRRLAARADDERTGDLQDTGCYGALKECAAMDFP